MVRPVDWKPKPIAEFLRGAQDTQRWIVPGFIAYEGLTLLSGPRKLGMKTCLADTLALVIALGVDIGALRCLDPGPVLYLEEEGTPLGTALRWEGLEFTYGFDLYQAQNLYYSFRPRVLLDDKDWATAIVKAVQEIRPKVVIFDALTYMHRGDENKTHEMRIVVDTLQTIRACGTACLFLAHTNQRGSEDPSLDIDLGVRGSKVILDAYDVHVGLRRASRDEPIKCHIRQREGSEAEYDLNWEFISEWNPATEAEEIWYAYPHFVTEADGRSQSQQDNVLLQLDYTKSYPLRAIAAKTRMPHDKLRYTLDRLAAAGQVEAVQHHGQIHYKRRDGQ